MLKYSEFLSEENVMDNPNFKKWFGKSKVVDKDGNPLVVYHGTFSNFKEFDKAKIGSTSDYGLFGRGFYFMNSKNTPYGDKVMALYLKIENPFYPKRFKTLKEIADYLDVTEDIMRDDRNQAYAVSDLFAGVYTTHVKEKGHDGIIVEHNPRVFEFVVFEPNQIKSVDNKGTFSKTTNNIYEDNFND